MDPMEPGVYFCEECRLLIEVKETPDCNCGKKKWVKKEIKEDTHEWECPECKAVGNYPDIRRVIDSGVDSCPDCRTPVNCCDT